MNPSLISFIGLLVLFALMFLRIPISFAMFIVGFAGLLCLLPSAAVFNLLTANVWNEFSSYSLSVIPLYILMGEIVFRSGISRNIFDAAYKWIGHFKGGMAATTILASAGFAAICGSNSATAATMSTMALPELKKYKYNEMLSTGSIATGGTLGIIIPPSTVLIIIGIFTQQPISTLFIASIIPGLFLVLLMILVIVYLCYRHPEYGPAGTKSTWDERIKALVGVLPILLLFVFVIGGLYAGWFTPTESGAFGAFGAIVITLLMRKLTWEDFRTALISTLRTSAMVMMLVVGAILFGRFLTVTRLPMIVADYVTALPLPSTMLLLIIIVVFIVGGSLMDALGFLIIAIPVFYPTLLTLGYDPIWIGVMLCVITSMGAITPPIGVNVFVVQGMSPSTSMITVFKGASYFLLAYAAFIALAILFPWII